MPWGILNISADIAQQKELQEPALQNLFGVVCGQKQCKHRPSATHSPSPHKQLCILNGLKPKLSNAIQLLQQATCRDQLQQITRYTVKVRRATVSVVQLYNSSSSVCVGVGDAAKNQSNHYQTCQRLDCGNHEPFIQGSSTAAQPTYT